MRKQKKQRPPVENQPTAPFETVPADDAVAEETVSVEVPATEALKNEASENETPTTEIPLYDLPAPDLPAPDVLRSENETADVAGECSENTSEATSAEVRADDTCVEDTCVEDTAEAPCTEAVCEAPKEEPEPDAEPEPSTDVCASSTPCEMPKPMPEAEPEVIPEVLPEALSRQDSAETEDAPDAVVAGPVPDIRDIAVVEELVEDGSKISIPLVPDTPAAAPEEQAEAPVVAAQAAEEPQPEPTQKEPEASAAPAAAVVASSMANKCFNALAWLGPLAALLFLVAQTLPGIDLRALVAGENILPALVDSMKHGADPLLLLLNGAPYPDLPPAYFWFLAGLDSLWQLTPLPYSMPLLLLGGSVVAAFLLLLMTWTLARVCGSDVREAFAACAVLLCTVAVCAMTRLAMPDLLFAACVAASCVCLYSGWMCTRAPLTLLLGFLLAGLAMLIEGPVGLVLPLAASLLFLFWRGTFRRAGAMDGAFGFAVLLVAIGGWLAWLGLTYGRAPAEALLNHHIPQWSLAFWSDPQRWIGDAAELAILLLPWPLLLLFLPWERLYRLPVLLWRNRKENPGIGFVWCALLMSLAILSFTYPGGTSVAPLLPFLAVILGRAVLRLSPLRSKGFFGLVGLAMFVSAVALGLCSALPFLTDWLPADLALPEACKAIAALPGMPFVAGATLLFSFILLKITDKTFPGGGLLVLVLFATVVMQPVALFTLPHLAPLNAVEAPTAPAETPAAPAEPAGEAAPVEVPAAPATEPAPVEPATPVAPAAPAAPEAAPAPVEVPIAPAETPAAETPVIDATPQTPTASDTPATPATPETPAETPKTETAPAS